MSEPRTAQPRWRPTKFGNNLELVMRKKWLGQVGPEIDGRCRYVTTTAAGYAATQEEARRYVEMEVVKL